MLQMHALIITVTTAVIQQNDPLMLGAESRANSVRQCHA
jgi:hypothetical protein